MSNTFALFLAPKMYPKIKLSKTFLRCDILEWATRLWREYGSMQ